jgi:hypothetical protein
MGHERAAEPIGASDTASYREILRALGACPGSRRTVRRVGRQTRLPPIVNREAAGGEVPPIVYEALERSGAPLDPGTRILMERRFGHNFAHGCCGLLHRQAHGHPGGVPRGDPGA